jgi:ferredoxin
VDKLVGPEFPLAFQPFLGGPTSAYYLPQGKVALYNTEFEKAGFTPMPEWREPPESLSATPALIEGYHLILSDYHTSKNFSASWQRNVPHLREIQPEPVLHIHPDAASSRQIQKNDWVIVKSPHAWMKVKAEIYPGIRPDTVMILHGWWQGCGELELEDYPLSDGGANVNTMYSVDPEKAISKNAKDGLVLVDKTLCTACGICAEACPFGVPQFADNGAMQKCDLCCGQQLARTVPPCVDTCPGKALLLMEVGEGEKKAHQVEISAVLQNL